MAMELRDIIASWVDEELPHFKFEDNRSLKYWVGFIYCKCEKSSPAVARIENDRIVLVSATREYGHRHDNHCEIQARLDWSRTTCYCGEDIIMLHDRQKFDGLKDQIEKRHKELMVRHH